MLPPQALLEHQPPTGWDSPSPQAREPGPLGAAIPRSLSLSTKRGLGRTPRPLKLVSPGRWELLPLQALLERRPPTRWDSPSPRAGEPGPLGTTTPRRPSLSDNCQQEGMRGTSAPNGPGSLA